MKKPILFFLLASVFLPAAAQRMLSLDSCRAMALRNNKQLSVAKLKQDVALNTQKAVRTKYLPKVDVMGAYEWTSKEVSLLKESQKEEISNIGTTMATKAGESMPALLTEMVQKGLLTPQQAQAWGGFLAEKTGLGLAECLLSYQYRFTSGIHLLVVRVYM